MAGLCSGRSRARKGTEELTASAEVVLNFHSSFCNDWPLIRISGNGNVLWQDRVIESQIVSVTFPRLDQNTVRIEYLNKRNGPNEWDTILDPEGQILQDQHCVLDTVMVNRCMCKWLIGTMPYRYPDGSQQMLHGFMDLCGWYEFGFPMEVEQWVLHNRRQQLPQVSQNSSLSYETIYIPDSNNEQVAQMVQELKILLNKIP
jgi:hypothetical protein